MSIVKDAAKEAWKEHYKYLSSHPDVYTDDEAKCRLFFEAVHWRMRTGADWRDLPARFGKWSTVYRRFNRWADRGLFQDMHAHFIENPDLEWLMVDSSVVRAHVSTAGAPKKAWRTMCSSAWTLTRRMEHQALYVLRLLGVAAVARV